MTTWKRVEVTKKTVRLVFPAPVDMKTLGHACTVVHREFEEAHGRPPSYDNDYWLEPMDEGIAFCFDVTTAETVAAPRGDDTNG